MRSGLVLEKVTIQEDPSTLGFPTNGESQQLVTDEPVEFER
jgi:hypothetical protein